MLFSSAIVGQNDKLIYHSSNMKIEKFELNSIIYKNKTDTNLLRVLLKIIPLSDSAKMILTENKTIFMFNKKDAIEILDRNNESIYANDYLYEEGYGYVYLIYTFLKIDISRVAKLKIQDDLITNSKKISII